MVMLFCNVKIPEGGTITLTFDDGLSQVKEVNYKKFVKFLPDELKGKDGIFARVEARKHIKLNNAKDVIEQLKQDQKKTSPVFRPVDED